METLKNNWREVGYDLYGFRNALKGTDKRTYFDKIKSQTMSLLTFTHEDEGKLYFSTWDEDKKSPIIRSVERETLETNAGEELVKELINCKNVLIVSGKAYFVGEGFIGTLASRLGLKGSPIQEPTLKRDEYIMEQIHNHPFKGTLMYRVEGDIKKAFAIHSNTYGPCKQEILADIVEQFDDELGEPVIKRWEIDQFLTRIEIEFPEKAKEVASIYGLPLNMVPGVVLQTSDTGGSSVNAIATWSIDGRRPIYDHEYARRHRGSVDPKVIHKCIEEEIFSNYTKLPERLCELMGIDIVNPATTYKQVLKALEIPKILGKTLWESLAEQVENSINPLAKYTAYDIAVDIMSYPERATFTGLNKVAKEQFAKAVTKAAYVNYNKKVEVIIA